MEKKSKIMKDYFRMYSAYTPQSIQKAVKTAISRGYTHRLDSVTLGYYLAPKKYGGAGMGKLKKVL
jgi:hypothetical protein